MISYATVADLGSHWDALDGAERDDIETALAEASAIVRTTLEQNRMDPTTVDPDVLRLVVCRMVRRAYPAEDPGLPAGLDSTQVSLGSFQQTLRWSGGRSGELLLYRVEKRLLGIVARAFEIDTTPEGAYAAAASFDTTQS